MYRNCTSEKRKAVHALFVVIDTNVLVSALSSNKDIEAAVQVLSKVLTGEIIPV